MKIKRFLMMLLFGPIMPLIGVPEGGDGENSNANDNTDSNTNDNNGENNLNDGNSGNSINEDNKVYTARDLEKKIEQRLKRDRIAQRKLFDEEKAKENLSAVEKANLERDEAKKEIEKVREEANNNLIRADVIRQSIALNIVDPDAAYSLMVKEDIAVENGKVLGVEEALKELIKLKPYLVNASQNNSTSTVGDDQTSNSNTTKNGGINDWIRKAAGRNK